MLIKVRLSEVDRTRLGCPEWLSVDPHKVSIREVIVLQKGVDLGDGEPLFYDSAQAWRVALSGRDMRGPDGKPVMVDVLEDGEPVIDPATGKATQKPATVADWQAEMVLVWLGLRRAQVFVPLAGLDYDSDALEWKAEDDEATEAGEPGKDPSTPETTSS